MNKISFSNLQHLGQLGLLVASVVAVLGLLGCAAGSGEGPRDLAKAPDVLEPVGSKPATEQSTVAPKPLQAPAPVPILPLAQALQSATESVFANVPGGLGQRLTMVVDPLIDGSTWAQSVATQNIEATVVKTVKEHFPRFETLPFTASALTRSPLVFIGTFTPLDQAGKNEGPTNWYRVCFALLDIRSGLIVSKGFARAAAEGVDHSPLPFLQDSPGLAKDDASSGYVRTCQGTKVGDPINPLYWDSLMAAAMVNEATNAYHQGRFEDAHDLYLAALQMPGGKQLRVYNGLYLTNMRLKHEKDAVKSFGDLVDYGLNQRQLGVKFLYQPGSTLFVNNAEIRRDYAMWLTQVANRVAAAKTCMRVIGHTSRSGAEPLNERLSLQRSLQIRQQLVDRRKLLAKQITATGVGSSKAIVGSGTDDARDAVDRRVEFSVQDCANANG